MFDGQPISEASMHACERSEARASTVVEAVLFACDLSEDEMEVGDLVDAALADRDPRRSDASMERLATHDSALLRGRLQLV